MSELLGQMRLPSGHVIQVRMGDLTREEVDAIVNPANERLHNGGGAAGAISRAIGPDFQEFCDFFVEEHGMLETGGIPMVYDVPEGIPVPFRKVISAVGPCIERCQKRTKKAEQLGVDLDDVVDDGPEFEAPTEDDCDLLYSAVLNSLDAAAEKGCEQISIPAISSGIFGFPKDLCAVMLFEAAMVFARNHPDSKPREIRFTNFDRPTCDIFLAEMNRLKTQFTLGE